MGKSMRLAKLMAAMGQDEEKRPLAVSHVGQIAHLREFAHRLDAGNPFRVGDLVTPREDAALRDMSSPHLVVAVREAVHDFAISEPGHQGFGAAYDTRVAHLQSGHVVMHWVEAVNLEPYDASVHERAFEGE